MENTARLKVALREATPEDVGVMLSIDGEHSPVFTQAQSYRKLLGEAGLVIVATRAKAVCGFAACSRILDEATLLNLVLEPEVREQGLARQLLRDVLHRLSRDGIRRCLLEVRESNDRAQSLYRSLGFVIDGRRERYYSSTKGGPAEAAVLMSRELEVAHACT